MALFSDRTDAGKRLAERLAPLATKDVVILGLPRGGIPVAAEVAEALDAPLDVIVVRKLGLPFQPELAMGAIGEDGARAINHAVVSRAGITVSEMAEVEQAERKELERRAQRFRTARPRLDLTDRTVIIVDDGVATGSTATAACQVARLHGAAVIVLAVPVAPAHAGEQFSNDADEFIALETPDPFHAVGQFYADFAQTTDAEVVDLLATADRRAAGSVKTRDQRSHPDKVGRGADAEIDVGPTRLPGFMKIPDDPIGIVVFAHGSGSSRHSPRNQYVASMLNTAGLATLLFDLLTPQEELDRDNVFNAELLGRRLAEVRVWLAHEPGVGHLPVGYFGASTGAAAALWAAAEPEADVAAVVSRGGRPDLAGIRLTSVTAPTRLIVGGNDQAVLELNRQAQGQLAGKTDLAIVAGASHLFEEHGTLHLAAILAEDWFTQHLNSETGATA
jgi:putative phosphoribosyl transferase